MHRYTDSNISNSKDAIAINHPDQLINFFPPSIVEIQLPLVACHLLAFIFLVKWIGSVPKIKRLQA